MKQRICPQCKQSTEAVIHGTDTPVCTNCGTTEFIEVEVPEYITCTCCKKKIKTEDEAKKWRDGKIPFLDMNNATYYCGCRGWD